MIVCGWYTPDYAAWAERLMLNLDELGHGHDFVEVPSTTKGWEANTMLKPAQVLAAMVRHPSETIVFLDVDCEVLARLDALDAIRGDVAFRLVAKTKTSGGTIMKLRSGTMVFRPTPLARQFVLNWIDAGRRAPLGTVDQGTMAEAIDVTSGLAVEILDGRYLAVASDECSDPIIRHDSASKATPKLARWKRQLCGMWPAGHWSAPMSNHG